jgi:hypothetical protein
MGPLKTIIEEDFQYLQEFLPKAYKPHGFMTQLKEVPIKDVIPIGMSKVKDGPHDGVELGQYDINVP